MMVFLYLKNVKQMAVMGTLPHLLFDGGNSKILRIMQVEFCIQIEYKHVYEQYALNYFLPNKIGLV